MYEIVAPGAFDDALDEFLSVGFIGGLNHNWDEPIGKPLDAKTDTKGLFVRGKISNTEHGQDVKILLKDEVIKKMSIGYRVKSAEYLETAEDVAAYWVDQGYTPNAEDIARSQYGARLLLKIKPLYEFSPVTWPANMLADITRVKRFAPGEMPTARELEEVLRRDVGLSRKNAKAFVLHGIKGLQRDADEAEPEATELAAPETVETEPETEATAEAVAPVEATTEAAAPVVETPPEAPVEAAPVVEAPKSLVDQAEVRALYAHLLNSQAARYARR